MFYIVLAAIVAVVIILKCVSILRMRVRRRAVEVTAEDRLARHGLSLVSLRRLRRQGKLGLLALQAMAPPGANVVTSVASSSPKRTPDDVRAWLGTAELTAEDESGKSRRFSLRVACPKRFRGNWAKHIRIEWTPSLSTIMTGDQKDGLAAKLDAMGDPQQQVAGDDSEDRPGGDVSDEVVL